MVNNLISKAAGTTTVIGSPGDDTYFRSLLSTVGMPTAVAIGAQLASGGGVNNVGTDVVITLTGTYKYLLAAYDGPNGGSVIYDVSSFVAGDILRLARNGEPIGPNGTMAESTRYQMTGWTLLNLNPASVSVPDAGVTAILLGLGFTTLGLIRRKMS
jgi:hypothetical protein